MPAFPRYGHTGIMFQRKFYVFGGKCKSNNYHYLADLEIFDLADNSWMSSNFNSKNNLSKLLMIENKKLIRFCYVYSN